MDRLTKARLARDYVKIDTKKTGLRGGAVVNKYVELYDKLTSKGVDLNNYGLKRIEVKLTKTGRFKLTPINKKGSILKTRSLTEFKKNYKPSFKQTDLFVKTFNIKKTPDEIATVSGVSTAVSRAFQILTHPDRILDEHWGILSYESLSALNYLSGGDIFENFNFVNGIEHLFKYVNYSNYTKSKLRKIMSEIEQLKQQRNSIFYSKLDDQTKQQQAKEISQRMADIFKTNEHFLIKTTNLINYNVQEDIKLNTRHGRLIKNG